MNYPMIRAGAVWAWTLLLAAGCTSRMPWERDWGQATSLSSFFGQDHSSLAGSTPRNGVTRPSQTVRPSGSAAANPVVAATESVTTAFKSVGEQVSSALEVKPKVIPAADPAKLSSLPERLSPALYLQAAQWSETQGAISTAQRQYEKALELDPRDVNSLIAFARFQDRHDHGEEAQRLYQQAQSLAPTNTTVLNDLGLFHARHGNLDAALKALDQAVRLDPRNVRYRNNLAAALIESRRVSEAIEVLRAVHPEAMALFNVACLLSLKNETQQAAALLEQSLRIDPSLAAAHDMLRKIRGPAASVAATAIPPGVEDGPDWNTAFRPRVQVWESTAVRDGSPGLTTSGISPRNLPPVE